MESTRKWTVLHLYIHIHIFVNQMVFKPMKDKKLKQEFDYYHNKVEEMEQERETDRSWELQKALRKYKKMKLKLKDMIYRNSQ